MKEKSYVPTGHEFSSYFHTSNCVFFFSGSKDIINNVFLLSFIVEHLIIPFTLQKRPMKTFVLKLNRDILLFPESILWQQKRTLYLWLICICSIAESLSFLNCKLLLLKLFLLFSSMISLSSLIVKKESSVQLSNKFEKTFVIDTNSSSGFLNKFSLNSYNKLTGSSFNLHLITLPSVHAINMASFNWKFMQDIKLLSFIFKFVFVKTFIVWVMVKFSVAIK